MNSSHYRGSDPILSNTPCPLYMRCYSANSTSSRADGVHLLFLCDMVLVPLQNMLPVNAKFLESGVLVSPLFPYHGIESQNSTVHVHVPV